MAIYHLSGTVISRSQGRSAVACAAYRSGERLVDERYQTIQDYSRKQDVAHAEILLPDNAPAWMSNREQLWNFVEAHEKRKDAQLAREFNFALPKELSFEQNLELARNFVQTQFVAKGMVVDLCIHLDKTKDGDIHPHAHVMLTMRAITQEGFGPKVRAWNAKSELMAWREAWSDTANHHLALNGHDIQIDHRTLEAQGIPLEPQHKLGPNLAPEREMKLADHQRIAKENGERLLAYPEIGLKALTQQQSTFSHQDLARFVNRHTLDAEQFTQVYEVIKNHRTVVYLGLDNQSRERFTTNEMLQLETQMLNRAKDLSQTQKPAFEGRAYQTRDLTTQQQEALNHLIAPGDLKSLIGYAGTGKSYLLGEAKEHWEQAGFRVQGLTLSGIASQTLEGSSGIESRTFASRCYYWDRGEQKLKNRDILVVDEAGLLGSRQMARVINEVHQAKAKLVLIGDPEQLQAIEAGAAFRAITEEVKPFELSEVRRQRLDWQKAATQEFAQGKTLEAIERYRVHHHIHEFATKASAKQGLIELWNDVRLSNAHQTQIILAYTRKDVQALNEAARHLRKSQNELGLEQVVQTFRGERVFAENDRVYFLKNDRDLKVMNGSLGTIVDIQGQEVRVRLDKALGNSAISPVISLNTEHYPYLDYGYAATIHKAQGVSVDRAYLLASRYLDRHATYVGLSRHREGVDLFWSREEFYSLKDLAQTLSRERAKDVSLDYSQTFGGHRDLEVEITPSQPQPQSQPTTERNIQSSFREQFEAAFPERARQLKENVFRSHKTNKTEMDIEPTRANTLEEFKKQFESEHPERAKVLQEALPSHQSLNDKTDAFVAEFNRLQDLVAKGGRTHYLAEHTLKQLLEKTSRQPELIKNLNDRHVNVAKEMEMLQKQFKERELSRELER